MRKSLFSFLIIITLTYTLSAQAQTNPRRTIVATTTQVADLARIIAGDAAEVIGIMGAGINPHEYRFTENDSTLLTQADIVLYSGLGFEGYVEVILDEFERRTPVYGVLNIVGIQGLALGSEDQPGSINSHAWHDPRNWMLATEGLVAFLSRQDPANAEIYAANGSTYLEHLQLIYSWAQEAMNVVPENLRVIVTAHDAFSYLGYAYNWRVEAVQGISTADEAGVGDIQSIVDFVITNQLPAIFVESSLPPDTIEAVQASAQSQGWDVQIGGELFADALDEPGRFSGTYIGMMHYNITLILTAYGYGDQIPPLPDALPQPENFAP